MYRLCFDSPQVTARGSLSKITGRVCSICSSFICRQMGPSCQWPVISQVSHQGCGKFSGPCWSTSCMEAALITVSVISFGPFATKVLGFPQSHGSIPPSWYAALNMLLIFYPLVQLEIFLDQSSLLGTVGFYPPLRLTQRVYSASVFL